MDVDEAYDLAFKYAKGQDGYEVDKEKSAYYLKIAADQGHLKAINNLAVAYDRGDGVPRDREKAACYYKMAADQGHTVAKSNFGFMLLKGKGIEQNKEEALRYFEMAADDGYTKVLDPIVQLFDEGIFNSFEEQLKYYKLAADNGNQSAMLSVVILLQDPESYELKRDKKALVKYARMLAETEHKGGMFMYADIILNDYVMYKDDEENEYYADTEESTEAAEFCKKSADLGNTDAMALYAHCLLNGNYVEKDEEAGLRYLLKSIEDDDEASDFGYLLYGKLLFKGDVVTQDRQKGLEYIKKAAKYYKEAMYEYVKLMMDPEVKDVPLDQDEAVYYSRRGAEKGEGHCMYYYALFLFDGNGVEQDREEAIEWLKKAFNQYIVQADYLFYRLLRFDLITVDDVPRESYEDEDEERDKLKVMDRLLSSAAICDIKQSYYQYAFNCEKGIGTDVDYENALRYYKLGAEDGNTKCMVRYGLMQELGKGVDKDPVEATKYYKMAADKDEYDGYYNYATMLNSGSGIEENQEEATKNFGEICNRGYYGNDGMFRYGYALQKGIGVKKDVREACHFYKQAAVQGDTNGMFFYGLILLTDEAFYDGYGYKKNIKEGWKYIKMAADHGNKQAEDYINNFF